MKFLETGVAGVFLIEIDAREDERGFFARTWCEDEFSSAGLATGLVQCSVSFNATRGTLRGLHLQIAPHAETKLVRVTRGSVFDVVADFRPGSASFGQWVGYELTAMNHKALYVPAGCAHGFLTLENESEVFYQMSDRFEPESARGVHWADEQLAVSWPFDPVVISAKDELLPRLSEFCEQESQLFA